MRNLQRGDCILAETHEEFVFILNKAREESYGWDDKSLNDNVISSLISWADDRDKMMSAVSKSNLDPATRYAKGAAWRGKSRPDHSEKMKVIMKGKAKTGEHIANISKAKRGVPNPKNLKAVIVNGVYYQSAKIAAECYGVAETFIKTQCRISYSGIIKARRKNLHIKLCVYA